MRWKRNAAFIIALILSIAYFYTALLNLIAPLHAPLVYLQGSISHPIFNFVYLVVSLIITWGFYLYAKRKPGKMTFILSLLIGIILIFFGMFIFNFADKLEDTVVTTPSQTT